MIEFFEEAFKNFIEDPIVRIFIQSFPAMAISLFGGLAAMFHKPHKLSVRFFIGGLFTAVFVGFLMNIISNYFGAGDNIRVLSIAVGGYSSSKVINIIERKFLKALDEADLNE